MLKKYCSMFLMGVALIFLGAAVANAAPVTYVDTLAISTYTGNYPSLGSGTSMFPNQRYAGMFTPLVGGSVTQISLDISSRFPLVGSGYLGAFEVEVFASSNGLPSGNALYTSTEQTANTVYPASFTNFNPSTTLQSISGINGFNLTAGQSYFMVVVGSQPLSDIDWWFSDNTIGTTDFFDGSTWSLSSTQRYVPAFKIIGDDGTQPPGAVPEPSTLLLLGAGLSGLAFLRRKKKE